MSADPITKANQVLDGIQEIARAEMLEHGLYLSEKVENPDRSGAVCHGHKACLVGSAYLGYGVRRRYDPWGYWELPGVGMNADRTKFVAKRPGLKLALESLDQVAERWMKRRGVQIEGFIRHRLAYTPIPGAIAEALFEGMTAPAPGIRARVKRSYAGVALTRGDVVHLAESARKIVNA